MAFERIAAMVQRWARADRIIDTLIQPPRITYSGTDWRIINRSGAWKPTGDAGRDGLVAAKLRRVEE